MLDITYYVCANRNQKEYQRDECQRRVTGKGEYS